SINEHDILSEPVAVRRSIGYVFQDTTLDMFKNKANVCSYNSVLILLSNNIIVF
ncbi:unnamed protein product, partial [marine sediment metagenome]